MNDNLHFKYIFWFIVGITMFGMGLTIFLLLAFKAEAAARFGDQALMFWLSTAVGGGIGYLIGASVGKSPLKVPVGTTITDTQSTISTAASAITIDDNKKEED